jgi:RHS repeat-associated protein
VILQDLAYTNDPVGNIVELDDTSIFATTIPSSKGLYVYDAIYRLISATGREHPGQVGSQPGPTDAPPGSVPSNANDLQALVNYTESYSYDRVGNILQMGHIASQGTIQWTRQYQYATTSNQLTATSRPGSSTLFDTYSYNAHGSMKTMPHLPVIDWDYADRMRHTNLGGGGDAFFTYDGSGQRVRKVWEHSGTIDERIYVVGWETFRHRVGTTIAASLSLERETLHVMDDKRRVAMVETKTIDTSGSPTGPLWRFQLDNHLSSSMLELSATGNVITYEEYHPYGTTSFHATDGSVSAKRYRYTGKEKDEETGLYYHGARYYAPWLGRWTAADPAGFVDGPDLYAYCRCSPIARLDPNGLQTTSAVPLGEHDVLYGIITHPKPLDASTWWAEGPRKNPAAWAGELSPWEKKYISTFQSSSVPSEIRLSGTVDPSHLSPEENASAARLFGTGAESAGAYANFENRRRILAHYVTTHPATVRLELGLFRFVRDINPIHFALERGWQVGSGKEMFTGEQKSRLGAAAEFFVALAAGYTLGGQAGELLRFAGEAIPGTRAPLSEATSMMAPGVGKNLAIAKDTLGFARQTLQGSGGRLRFNLNEFNTQQAVTPGSPTYGSVTSAEYRGILGDAFLRGRTSFYSNGADVTAQILRGAQ